MIVIDYVCTGCGKEWTHERHERDYTYNDIFYDGEYYGDDSMTRICPTCGKPLKETGRKYITE